MRVGLAGFGTAGQEVARRLVAGAIPGVRLAAVTARDLDKASARAARLEPPPAVVPLADLPEHAEVIAECTSAQALPEILRICLGASRTVLVVSAAGLLEVPDAENLARRAGGRLRIANGAVPGLDALRCARAGSIRSVRLTSRLRPDSLAHEDYVRSLGFDFASRPPAEPVRVFAGSAREAAATSRATSTSRSRSRSPGSASIAPRSRCSPTRRSPALSIKWRSTPRTSASP
jgi:aspartate dehydrogenase